MEQNDLIFLHQKYYEGIDQGHRILHVKGAVILSAEVRDHPYPLAE